MSSMKKSPGANIAAYSRAASSAFSGKPRPSQKATSPLRQADSPMRPSLWAARSSLSIRGR